MYNFPQMAKFKGVSIMAEIVAIAVRLTDKATLPFEREEIKFEMFPPGHEATKIMPMAMVGVIRLLKANMMIKVTAGRKKNWETKPMTVAFGLRRIFRKCSSLISSATPNIIKASVRFKTNKPSAEKFSFSVSRTSNASLILIVLISRIS